MNNTSAYFITWYIFADEFSYNIHHEGESFNSIFNFSAFESFSNCLSIKLCLTYEDSNMRFFCLKPGSHRQDMAQDTARTCHDQEFRSENSFNS